MREPPERHFRLPGRPRDPWWLWLLVLALHVPLVAFVIIEFRHHGLAVGRTGPPAIALQPGFTAGNTVPHEPPLAAPLTGALRRAPPAPPTRSAAVPAGPAGQPPAPPTALAVAGDTGGSAVGGTAYLTPSYGSGKVWVQPLPMTPQEITAALTGKTRAQLDDSIVTRMVQTYLDDLAEENRINLQSPPSWTTTIGGKKVGLDQRWIYLGPIRIPAALLALLPLHLQANPTEYQFNQRLQQMRAVLFEAARRSATYDDFKQAVKDLRAETQRQRDFDKAQRTPPSDSGRS